MSLEEIKKLMDSTAKKNKYATCCANEYGGCGPYIQYRKPVDELFEIIDLTNETKPHLVRLKLKHIYDSCMLSEKCLIESRLGKVVPAARVTGAFFPFG